MVHLLGHQFGAFLGLNQLPFGIFLFAAQLEEARRRNMPVVVHTREAAEDIRFIHARMPVILPQSCALDWLNPENVASDMMGRAVTKMEHSIA